MNDETEAVIVVTADYDGACPMKNCGCVGYGYVPIQYLNETFCVEQALEEGTLFPELALTICEYGKVCKGNGGI